MTTTKRAWALLRGVGLAALGGASRWVSLCFVCGWLSAPVFAHHNFDDAEDLGRTTDWESSGREYVGEIGDARDNGYGYEYLRFEVAVAGSVRVWTSGGISPTFTMLDANRVEVRDWSTSSAWEHLEAGTHYIVTASRSIGERYRLHVAGGGRGHDDIGNTLAEARTLSQSDVVPWDGRATLSLTARIDYRYDLDWYKFDVPEGPPMFVRIWSSGGSTDTYALLYDEDDFLLEDNHNSGSGYNFLIDRHLDTGTYYVRVGRWEGGVGPYRLHLAGRDDHGSLFETASLAVLPTTNSNVISGEIDYRGDVDRFWFQVSTAGRVRLWSSGDTDTYGILHDAFEIKLEENHNSGPGYNFLIDRHLDTGTYYVQVGGGVGPYQLHLSGDASGVLTVPLMLAHGDTRTLTDGSRLGRRSFIRLINHSDQPATVGITAVDDTGMRSALSPLNLTPWQTLVVNSNDLENGNPAKGIVRGVGNGTGNWYLEVAPSRPEVEVLSFARTNDGLLAPMHAQVPSYGGTHRVATFNPGSNRNQVSRLRLINPRCPQFETAVCQTANATLYGIDDAGARSPDVQLQVVSGATREVTAAQLEGLDQDPNGLVGRLHDGTGKWQLFIAADQTIHVMSLLETPTGHLTNLSAPASRQPYSTPERP